VVFWGSASGGWAMERDWLVEPSHSQTGGISSGVLLHRGCLLLTINIVSYNSKYQERTVLMSLSQRKDKCLRWWVIESWAEQCIFCKYTKMTYCPHTVILYQLKINKIGHKT
jgi:hypothetical protein